MVDTKQEPWINPNYQIQVNFDTIENVYICQQEKQVTLYIQLRQPADILRAIKPPDWEKWEAEKDAYSKLSKN